ncbi:MAG: TIGR01777 family oxidoreductase [Gemmatimonadota bacterium]|nr:TIGR01777 family oxidoreductase [Gemmatimonadota bacterium]
MRVFITGGSGFIGSHLVRVFAARGHECVVLSRSGRDPWDDPAVRVVRGDPVLAGRWQTEVAQADVIVNLAGAKIVDPPHRWTEARKSLLRRSRIDTTQNLVAAMKQAATPPEILLSSSAIGFYGVRGDAIVDESAPPGDDFLAALAQDWEAAALEAQDVATVALLRTGLVLGQGGGVLDALLPLFRLGLGGPWGSGDQWWSWIHLADHIELILYALDHRLSGPINLTAPNPVTVAEFAAALGKALHRPAFVPAPAFVLRLMLGEAADALLDLQRAIPTRALDAGFEFQFPALDQALEDLLR